MAVTFDILNIKGFKEANSSIQVKEMYTLYGLNTSLLSNMDHFFINQLWIKKSEFDTHSTGARLSEEEHKKFSDYYLGKATLGTLMKDFALAYDTTGFDDFFCEMKRVRNLLAHRYDVFRTYKIEEESERIIAYNDLLGIYQLVENLKIKLSGRPFKLLSNSNFLAKFTMG